MARNTNTAITPAPTAPMIPPTIIDTARSVPQSRVQPMSAQPYPMAAPTKPVSTTAA